MTESEELKSEVGRAYKIHKPAEQLAPPEPVKTLRDEIAMTAPITMDDAIKMLIGIKQPRKTTVEIIETLVNLRLRYADEYLRQTGRADTAGGAE